MNRHRARVCHVDEGERDHGVVRFEQPRIIEQDGVAGRAELHIRAAVRLEGAGVEQVAVGQVELRLIALDQNRAVVRHRERRRELAEVGVGSDGADREAAPDRQPARGRAVDIRRAPHLDRAAAGKRDVRAEAQKRRIEISVRADLECPVDNAAGVEPEALARLNRGGRAGIEIKNLDGEIAVHRNGRGRGNVDVVEIGPVVRHARRRPVPGHIPVTRRAAAPDGIDRCGRDQGGGQKGRQPEKKADEAAHGKLPAGGNAILSSPRCLVNIKVLGLESALTSAMLAR